MPIISPTVSLDIVSFGAPTVVGPMMLNLANAISLAVVSYTLSSVKVFSINTGLTGPVGTGVGAIVNNNAPALEASLLTSFSANGIVGERSLDLARAISLAFFKGLSTAIDQTPVAGVSLGTGVGLLVSTGPVPLEAQMTGLMALNALFGEKSAILAKAISEGYVTYLSQLTTIHAITGSPPIPPVPSSVPAVGFLV